MENNSYQKSFLFSFLFHAVILIFLFIHLHEAANYRLNEEPEKNNVIQALAVDASQLAQQMSKTVSHPLRATEKQSVRQPIETTAKALPEEQKTAEKKMQQPIEQQ